MGNRGVVRLLSACLAGFFLAFYTDAAFAGPGGLIKVAAETPLGRVVLFILAIILSPFLIYDAIKRATQARRTKADLELLARADVRYHWLNVKDRVTEAFQWTWSAWSQQKMEKAAEYTTDWYWRNQQMQLDEWESRGQENVCQLFGIKNITPIFVEHCAENEGDGSRLVVEFQASVTDYLRDKATGKLIEGDKKRGDLTAIWTFLWRNGAWRLNLIEPALQRWDYIAMPNVLPESLAETQQRRT